MSYDLSGVNLTPEQYQRIIDNLMGARMTTEPCVMYINLSTMAKIREAHRWRKTPAGRYYFRMQARRPPRHARARRRH